MLCSSGLFTHYNGYILRIDCAKAEENLKTTPSSQEVPNALVVDDPLEHTRLVLNNEMADWVWAVENLAINILITRFSILKESLKNVSTYQINPQ